jgi:hypothetical protein
MFLVRCRDCGSRLLQPEQVVGPVDARSIVARFCPECERHDVVVADDEAVQVWLRREERIRESMTAVADRCAEVSAREAALDAPGPIGRPPGTG